MSKRYKFEEYPDGSMLLTVKDMDDEIIKFDCINGNILVSGDMCADYDEEPMELTFSKIMEYAREFLWDHNIDSSTIDGVCNHLAPWFQKYAISEEDAIRNQIKELMVLIGATKKSIERNKRAIRDKEYEVRSFTKRAERYIDAHREEIEEYQMSVCEYARTIKELKKQLADK